MHKSQKELVTTARMAGVFYLTMAVSGILGFLVFHAQVFDSEDARKTVSNIVDVEYIARTRLILEFAIVVSQALTAVWFYKLLKSINEWAAWTVGIWGMVNAIIIMVSAISMGSAIEIATSSQSLESKILLIDLLCSLITHAWSVGGLFFGLWIIPLGHIITSSKRMPIWLGRVLIVGGIGYLLSTLLNYLGVNSSAIEYLTVPATIGEFWMIGYLLLFGIRESVDSERI